jgi:hypothetical protein
MPARDIQNLQKFPIAAQFAVLPIWSFARSFAASPCVKKPTNQSLGD